MIVDHISRAPLYMNMHPRLREAFEQLSRTDLAMLPTGRNTVKPWLHVDIVKGNMIEKANSTVEIHRRYTDIHLPLNCQEIIGWMDLARCTHFKVAYPEKDAEIFSEMCESWMEIQPGYFALFFTEEGHAPMVGAGPIHKAVIKVALD